MNTLPHSRITETPHIYARWRHFNLLIDAALAAGVQPWALAEAICASIWAEWAVTR